MNNTSTSTSTTQGSDNYYTYEIARGSVARAALHLNITSISSDALDALTQSLLTYMNNLSHIIAMQCEHSGRSSAHANLLDVFVGIGLAANVHCNHGGSNGSNYERGGSEWEKLAQFVFGADWYR